MERGLKAEIRHMVRDPSKRGISNHKNLLKETETLLFSRSCSILVVGVLRNRKKKIKTFGGQFPG